MRILLVRHYKTLINLDDRIMGWGDAPRAGDWEADLLHVEATLREAAVRVDAIYSSALERARGTARYYARQRGIHLIHESPALNEVNYGELYRKPKKWVARHIPEYKTDPDYVFPGGESFRQMQRRSVAFVTSLQLCHPTDTLLLVVHAGVIRGLVCHFLGLPFGPNLKRKVSHRYLGELVIERDHCVHYDEIGVPSGFVREGAVRVPHLPEWTGAALDNVQRS